VEASGRKAQRRLLRMSELAALTEVPPASIKFYIKEGLLPAPVKTSRNMAYYDETFVEKIRVIKKLQSQHFLPLRVIKEILLRTNGEATVEQAQALLALRGLHLTQPHREGREPLSESEVIRRLNTYEAELDDLRRMGLLHPREMDGVRMYDADDQELLEALQNNRRLGFTRDIGFQVKDLEIYAAMLEVLANEEVKLLISHTASKLSGEDIRALAEKGLHDFGPMLMIIRKKMILKVLSNLEEALGEDEQPEASPQGTRE
jgi:DNA-binding transcriptional MerR regulator